MSPDNNSPVKGFRPLGGSQNEQPEKPGKQDNKPMPPSPTPSSSFPPPAPAPSSLPPEHNAVEYKAPDPEPWENSVNNSRTAAPPPWQQEATQKVVEPQQPYQQQPYQPQYSYTAPFKNPGTAFVLELIGGIFGLFGIGYMYAGKTSQGVIRLIAGILCNLVLGFIFVPLTAGICAFIAFPFYIGFAIISANSIKNYLTKQQTP